MIAPYLALSSALAPIRSFITASDEHAATTDDRVFAYIAWMVSLYAAFEQFAEQLAFEFASAKYVNEPTSGPISDDFQALYTRNSAALLQARLGEGRYEQLTYLDVAESLVSLLRLDSPPSLLGPTVAMHAANLRLDGVTGLFAWGLKESTSKLCAADAMREWGASTGFSTSNGNATDSAIRAELEDLVERRNEVSHRGSPQELLSGDLARAKVDFVDALARGLVALLAGQVLGDTIDRGALPALGRPTEEFQKGFVVVIDQTLHPVAVGAHIAARWPDGSVRWGEVRSLQLTDNSVTEASAGMEVGLELDFNCRGRPDLYVCEPGINSLYPVPPTLFGSKGPRVS